MSYLYAMHPSISEILASYYFYELYLDTSFYLLLLLVGSSAYIVYVKLITTFEISLCPLGQFHDIIGDSHVRCAKFVGYSRKIVVETWNSSWLIVTDSP